MLISATAELPALAQMSSHGAGVLSFEFAGSTPRLREIITGWGTPGLAGAQQHIVIDLGFILGYGTLLWGACGRLANRLEGRGRSTAAAVAAWLAWAAVVAAAINALQKLLLWLEIHGHAAQPLPALAAACGAITFVLATPAALFALGGTIERHR